MVAHCRKPANKVCLEMLSESGDLRHMEWARLASDDEYVPDKLCPCCGADLVTSGDIKRHLRKPGNAACLHHAENSGDERMMNAFEMVTTGEPTRPCPCCHTQFPRSNYSCRFQNHIKATKNIACLIFVSKSTDPSVLKCYKVLQ